MDKARLVFRLAGLAMLLLLGGCGPDDGSYDTGRVQVALTDAADHSFSEVVIAIEEVRAVPAGDEMRTEEELPLIVAFDPPLSVNVLELAYAQEVLGEATLAAGEYNQLRLVLAENTDPMAPANYVVLADDPEQLPIAVDTPSAHRAGLKLVGRIALAAGQTASVSLDFDPARAIVESADGDAWNFKPTGIRVVQTEAFLPVYGALVGKAAHEVATTGGILEEPVTGAMVYAVTENGTTATASGMSSTEDGTFRLLLPPGAYELKVTAEGYAEHSTFPFVFEVFEGEDTDAGTLLLTAEPLVF